MTKKQGGPAFATERGQNGVTLRDYFAAKAMQSIMLASMRASTAPGIAKLAYAMAGAMLAERERQE